MFGETYTKKTKTNPSSVEKQAKSNTLHGRFSQTPIVCETFAPTSDLDVKQKVVGKLSTHFVP